MKRVMKRTVIISCFFVCSIVFLFGISILNIRAIPLFSVSGSITNPNGTFVNGLEVTVANQTRHLQGKSVTGKTGKGRYNVVFIKFGGSSGEVGDILVITVRQDGKIIRSVKYPLTKEDIQNAHVIIDIQLDVHVPSLAVNMECKAIDTFARLKRQTKESSFEHLLVPRGRTYSYRSAVLPNYPNPFNPATWIPYVLSKNSDVIIQIYDTTGKRVRRLNIGHRKAGIYISKTQAAYWDGLGDNGELVANGIYFCTFHAGSFAATRRMMVRK